MNLNKIALCGVVAGSVAAMGCGSTTTPPGTDAGGGGGTDAFMEPVDMTYIVGEISIPSMPDGTMPGTTPGFNLDGKVSVEGGAGNCEDFIQDYVNEQGETGVDNQLVGSLIGLLSGFVTDLDVQATVDEQISTGALLLAMRVNGINSFENDSSVTLDLFLVDPAGCAMSPCAPTGGTVSADQMWAMQAGPALATGLSATIEGGVLSGGPLDLPLSFEASGMTINLTIRDARVGGDISADGLANGNIGGELRIEDIIMLAEMIMPGIGDVARGILQESADLSPSSDPMVCDSISAGIGFSAVPGAVE